MIRHSQEKKKEINRRLNDLKREVQLINMKATAMKQVKFPELATKQIDMSDYNDYENNEFQKKAIFNEYTRKLLGDGDINKFQKEMEEEGYVSFFINNYPRIVKEVKMYNRVTQENLFRVVERLFRIERRELNMMDEEKDNKEKLNDAVGLLTTISNNLGDLKKLADTQYQADLLFDKQQKVDAILACIKSVKNEVAFLQTLLKVPYSNIINQLSQDAANTQPPTDPNAPAPIINTPVSTIVDTISAPDINQGFSAVKSIFGYDKVMTPINSAKTSLQLPDDEQDYNTPSNSRPTSPEQEQVFVSYDDAFPDRDDFDGQIMHGTTATPTTLSVIPPTTLSAITPIKEELDVLSDDFVDEFIKMNKDKPREFIAGQMEKYLYPLGNKLNFYLGKTKKEMFNFLRINIGVVRNKIFKEEEYNRQIIREETVRTLNLMEDSIVNLNNTYNSIRDSTLSYDDRLDLFKEFTVDYKVRSTAKGLPAMANAVEKELNSQIEYYNQIAEKNNIQVNNYNKVGKGQTKNKPELNRMLEKMKIIINETK